MKARKALNRFKWELVPRRPQGWGWVLCPPAPSPWALTHFPAPFVLVDVGIDLGHGTSRCLQG